MINDFKEYFLRHDQPIYENPSPGNKAGGLTTLEEKSLGAIQKGGRAPVTRVLRYGEPRARRAGSSLLESPGNDGVSSTAMVVSGATLLLFTTGRGTPLGFPGADDQGVVEQRDRREEAALDRLRRRRAARRHRRRWRSSRTSCSRSSSTSRRASTLANNERNGYREIAIWKEGVTL